MMSVFGASAMWLCLTYGMCEPGSGADGLRERFDRLEEQAQEARDEREIGETYRALDDGPAIDREIEERMRDADNEFMREMREE